MKNVVSLLKTAVLNKDWGLVNEAVSLLCGEVLVQEVRKEQTAGKVNKFNPKDFVVEEEPEMKKYNDNVKPVPRNRPPSFPVEVTCFTCGKKVYVPPSLAKENFRCDNCLYKIIKK